MAKLLTNSPSKLLGGGNVKWYRAGGAPVPVAVYQPKGAASLAASYVNLARTDGTYNAAPGTAPTLVAGGWSFDRTSSQYLRTGVTPTSAYSAIIAFSDHSGAGDNYLFGCRNTTNSARFGVAPNSGAGATVAYWNGTTVVTVAPALTGGVLAVTPERGYRNGTAEGAALPANANPGLELFIAAYNNNGGGAANYSTVVIKAFAIYSTTLTAAQVAAVTLAMQNL